MGYALALSVAVVASFVLLCLIELVFWLFCWCFVKVDSIFQERHWRRLRENILSE